MWVEYNPNPKRRSVIDCTVRALECEPTGEALRGLPYPEF